MAETVRTRHRISGMIDENTPRHIAEHPVLGRYLDIVSDGVKPYLPEMHKPKGPKSQDSKAHVAPNTDSKE